MSALLKKSKIIWMILILLGFVLFDLVLENTSVSDRAVAVAMAVDEAENGKMEISMEFAIPSSSAGNGGSSSSNFTVVKESGESVNEIIDKMSEKMGLTVSLAHVGVVIVGEEVAKKGDFSFLQYLLRSNMLTDAAYLVTSEGKGADILKVKAPTSSTGAFHLQDLFSSSALGVNGVTIREFASRALEKGGANFLPYLKKVKTEPDSEEEEKDGEFYFIKADTTAAFNEEGMRFLLNERESVGLSLAKRRIEYGNIDFTNEKNEKISVQIISSNRRMDLSLSEMSGIIHLNVNVRVKEKTDGTRPIGKTLSESERNFLAGEIRARVLECYALCAENGIDLFGISGEMMKRYSKEWENAMREDYLKKFSLSVGVDLSFR